MHAVIGVVGLVFLVGCGTVLQVTDKPLGTAELAQLRAGASALQCREQPSNEFALFLVCPEKNQSIGFSAADGKAMLTCNHYWWPRNCRRLNRRLLDAGSSAVINPALKGGAL